ncbi:MAG TPA: hypothetical protein VGH33_00525 [Isosphaeraceae bacterium]|jgi:hypothetical protein
MSTTFKSAAESYVRATGLSRGTRNEYTSTVWKWERRGGGGPIERVRPVTRTKWLPWTRLPSRQENYPSEGIRISSTSKCRCGF